MWVGHFNGNVNWSNASVLCILCAQCLARGGGGSVAVLFATVKGATEDLFFLCICRVTALFASLRRVPTAGGVGGGP